MVRCRQPRFRELFALLFDFDLAIGNMATFAKEEVGDGKTVVRRFGGSLPTA